MKAKSNTKKKNSKKILVKNTFLQGAFISTLGIVISKILGILHVIPFNAVVKEQGGALYGYAYTLYSLFLGLSSAGIPLAVSKIISEYHTLGYYNAKMRAFKLGRSVAVLLGFIAFIVLFIFAPSISHAILGDLSGGNTLSDVTFVIRIISTAIVVVPLLSIYRGYLEGHKYLAPTSISNVIEQVVRVGLIIFGSFLAIKVFHQSIATAVGIAVFGATAGALVSYFYLLDVVRKNKKALNERDLNVKEPTITNQAILKKILLYSLPFIMIDGFKSLYDFIDMTTVVKTLADTLSYSVSDAESVMSIISTWGNKFNMIISAVSTGVIVSLIPNLTASFVVGDKKDVNKKVNQTLQVLLFLTVPMTIGLSFLAKPVWMVFYGSSKYGASVFCYFVYIALFMSIYTATVTIVQVLKDYKIVFLSLFLGSLLKILFNVHFMILFDSFGIPAYYGSITATIFGYFVSLLICMYALYKRFAIHYQKTLREMFPIGLGVVFMICSMFFLRLFIPVVSSSRFLNIPIIMVYTLVGASVYFFITYRMGTFKRIVGDEFFGKLSKKLKKS